MPNIISNGAGTWSASNVITIAGLTCGSSNNRAIFIAGGSRINADVVITNATYGATSLSLITNMLDSSNGGGAMNQSLGVWGATGLTETGSNTLRTEWNFGESDEVVVAVTMSDVSSNGATAQAFDSAATGDGLCTNSHTSATNRIGFGFWAYADVADAITYTGSAGHAALVDQASANVLRCGISAVDPSETNLVISYGSLGNNFFLISLDAIGPAPPPPATNVTLYGIG